MMNQGSYLVIGASSGIGLETCRLLAAEGCNIVGVSSSSEKLGAALNSLAGAGHHAFACDLAKPESVGSLFEDIRKNGIMLDGMVYSAGVSPLQLVKDNDYKLAERVFNINVLSFIECARCFYGDEGISRDGSRIVAVTSVTARAAGYRQTLYGSSKAALIAAVKLMAKELLNRDMRVNCVSPGCTDTAMLSELYEDSDSMAEAVGRIQQLGVIPAANVAQLIVQLLSPFSDYLTGSEIVYDAGFTLR